LPRVQLNDSPQSPGGACIQGVTHSDQIAFIMTDQGNGPGVHTAGLDIQGSYSLPVGPGDLNLEFTGTWVTTMDRGATLLDGQVVTQADNRLGYLNYSGFADAVPEIRANAAAGYRLGDHNLRFSVNYVSAVEDERSTTVYGKYGEEWIVADITWLWDISPDLRFTASALNIFDRDPPRVQQEMGFDPLLGNPFGRMFEVAVKKTF
jgi:iron complex outermembrane receptor protein